MSALIFASRRVLRPPVDGPCINSLREFVSTLVRSLRRLTRRRSSSLKREIISDLSPISSTSLQRARVKLVLNQ